MGNELQHHASEKAEWIAQTLEGQIAQSTAQQQFSVAESRDVLVGHVLNAQANNKAMEQRYGELSQTMQSLKADIEKVHGEVSAWQGQVLRLHEESTQQSRAAIDTAFRSVRRMHAITLVMVAGCLLQGILTLWPIFMK